MAVKLAPAIRRPPGRVAPAARWIAGVAVGIALLAGAFAAGRSTAPPTLVTAAPAPIPKPTAALSLLAAFGIGAAAAIVNLFYNSGRNV